MGENFKGDHKRLYPTLNRNKRFSVEDIKDDTKTLKVGDALQSIEDDDDDDSDVISCIFEYLPP